MSNIDWYQIILLWIWPIVSGKPTSIIAVFLVYSLQKPNLNATTSNDPYTEGALYHFVHLQIKNILEPFLGGGTATRCRGKIALQDRRSFVTKWADRAEPIRFEVVKEGENWNRILLPEPSLLDQAKYEYLRPGDVRGLDVAVRYKGDSSCFIHEPENFMIPGQRPENRKLGIGSFNFKCVLEYEGGTSKPFYFKIVNKEGESPGLLSTQNVDSKKIAKLFL